jgi:phosphatidate cytidylyltransferase
MIRQRVMSAVVIAVLLISAVLWLPAWWSAAVFSLVLAAAAWEWSGFLGAARALQRVLFLIATVLACFLLWQWTASASGLRQALWLALLFWSVVLLWVFWLPQQTTRASVFGAGVLALSLAWVALVRMRIGWSYGHYAVLYTLLIVWLADSGAYFAGRAWGVRKLAPQVSPGKTWAGFWGGLAACAVLGVVGALLASQAMLPVVLLTMAVGVYSVVGDLVESLCKRFAGLKDSGTLIPGHGGVLDRFDSLLAAAPCLMLGIELFGRGMP